MTESQNKKVDVRVKRTYNQLADALLRLLSKKSFDDLTVLEICNEAGVHRATFYKHFVDKHDFLCCCFKMKLAELDFEKPGKNFSIEMMRSNCMKMVAMVLTFIEDNRDFVSRVSSEHYSASFTNALSDAIAAFIVEQIQTKVGLSEKLGYNLPLMANYYSGAIVGLTRWWATAEDPCSRKVFLEFAKRKVDDLCGFFESFISEDSAEN